jgi:hypothetical protein
MYNAFPGSTSYIVDIFRIKEEYPRNQGNAIFGFLKLKNAYQASPESK